MADLRAALLAAGASPAAADTWAEPLAAAAALHDISGPRRLAAFLAQCSHESARFTRLEEDLRYRTPARLDAMFSAVRGEADAAALIAKGPEAIANRVYAGRNGNGDEASGDGARFIGRGLLQLTGRRNYRQAGDALRLPLESRPESVAMPSVAALTAAWYWLAHDCNRLADRGDIDGITRAINGAAMAGTADRATLYQAALNILEHKAHG